MPYEVAELPSRDTRVDPTLERQPGAFPAVEARHPEAGRREPIDVGEPELIDLMAARR